jgi:hypothetical protein
MLEQRLEAEFHHCQKQLEAWFFSTGAPQNKPQTTNHIYVN